jgi:preprotein translocase subunit SecG
MQGGSEWRMGGTGPAPHPMAEMLSPSAISCLTTCQAGGTPHSRAPFSPLVMQIFIGFLTVIEILVCLLLILLILMQRPRQEGLGATFAADAMNSLAGTQATNVLQKGTTWLCGALFVITVLLGALIARNQSGNTKLKLANEPAAVKPVEAPAATPAAATPGNITVTPAGATTAPIKVEATPAAAGAAPAAPTIKVEPAATKPGTPAAPTIKVEPVKPAAAAPVAPTPAAPVAPAAAAPKP